MVTSLNQTRPARESGYEGVQYISTRHLMTGTDLPVTKVGTLPIGAIIMAIHSKVVTAVTGGTPVLGVGTNTSNIGTNGNISNAFAETAGSELVQPATTVVQPLTADTEIYVGTTGGATTGDVYLSVAFIKPIA